MTFAEKKFKLLQRLNNANFLIIYFDPLHITNSIVIDTQSLTIITLEAALDGLFEGNLELSTLDLAGLEGLITGITDVTVDLIYLSSSDIQVLTTMISDLDIAMTARTAISVYTEAIRLKSTFYGKFLADLEFEITTTLAMSLNVEVLGNSRLAVETSTNLALMSSTIVEASSLEQTEMSVEVSESLQWTTLMTFMFMMSLVLPSFNTSELTLELSTLEPSILHPITASILQVSPSMILLMPTTLAVHDPKTLITMDDSTLSELIESII